MVMLLWLLLLLLLLLRLVVLLRLLRLLLLLLRRAVRRWRIGHWHRVVSLSDDGAIASDEEATARLQSQ